MTSDGGYYRAELGAGKVLLEGIDRYVGREVPLLLYGFSGGAHFVSSLEEWRPERVLAWCAFSAAWWEAPKASVAAPPGVVVCGKLDVDRYEATRAYFEAGRRLGKRWGWVSLCGVGHAETPVLDGFVLAYFRAVLERKPQEGGWRDGVTRGRLAGGRLTEVSVGAVWWPDEAMASIWEGIDEL